MSGKQGKKLNSFATTRTFFSLYASLWVFVCVRARQVVIRIIFSIRAYESLRNGSRFLLLLRYL